MVEVAFAYKTPDGVQAAYRLTNNLGTKGKPGARLAHGRTGCLLLGTTTWKPMRDADD